MITQAQLYAGAEGKVLSKGSSFSQVSLKRVPYRQRIV